MRTKFRTEPQIARSFLRIARATPAIGLVSPDAFKQIMQTNKGVLGMMSQGGCDKNGLERRNPIIVALGDSVTAGHFEWLVPIELMKAAFLGKLDPADPAAALLAGPIEVTDARESYIEKFRLKLIDKYEQTSVSVINCGIAGDNIIGMHARLSRDVISHQPDLVLINGSLNWGPEMGNSSDYYFELKQVVQEIKTGTEADIILITPNMDMTEGWFDGVSKLPERVEVIRQLAAEEEVSLADTYAIWEEYKRQGYPLEALLANGINHPSVTGHEVYALALMQLFR